MEKVNDVIEATLLLTEKLTSQVSIKLLTLQQLLRLKLRLSKMSVSSKKKHQQKRRRLDIQYESANK